MTWKTDNNNIVIKSMEGIGDQIYQRPFIKYLVEHSKQDVYLSTFLPQIYKDIDGLKFLDPRRKNPSTQTYRTQRKAIDNSFNGYVREPARVGKHIDALYKGEDVISTSIVATFFKKFGVDYNAPIEWSLPKFTVENRQGIVDALTTRIPALASTKFVERKIAIIRPATVRKEWEVHTRNPNPDYIDWCAKVLIEQGYLVISIADADGKEEWLVHKKVPPAHIYLHHGELGVFGTLDLISVADIVVGGPGFIVPAAVAAHVPLFTIFGGRMAYDTPYKLFHSSMDMTKIGWAVPDNPCRCTEVVHNCDKKISDLDTRFMEFLGRIN